MSFFSFIPINFCRKTVPSAVTRFTTPLRECKSVTLFVLLKKDLWGWHDQSKMTVRFWCDEMGGGDWDCGQLQHIE